MKEQTEFCAGVKILIERMETTPEDFDEADYDLATMTRIKHKKFSKIASALDQMVVGKTKTVEAWIEWNYLSKEEQTALLNAYRKMRRTQFDKQIMERVFDETYYQRQEDEEQQHRMHIDQQMRAMRQQIAQQAQIAAQPSTALNQGVYTTNHTGSLLGSATNALSGIFK